MKILWLVSWYPNKNDQFDGDFIQRHARAAAIYHDVQVIFVTDSVMEKKKDQEWNYISGLTEQVIYFKRYHGWYGKLRKQWTWRKLFRAAIIKYIDQNGLPDVVHIHVPWKVGLLALWMKKKFGVKFMISEHWGIYDVSVAENYYTRSKLFQRIVRAVYKSATRVTSVSKYLAMAIEQTTGRRSDMVLPNVVDTSLFFVKAEKYSKFSFIHVSNMAGLKNVDRILEAFRNLIEIDKEVQLVMVGNRNNRFKEVAEKFGLLNTHVFFRGEISYADVADEMKRSHCMVLFSDSETFSCVTAEALCCGLPVIASDVGALPDLVHQSNGVLVPIDHTDALTNAMLHMIRNYGSYNPKQIAEEASKKFSYSTIALQFDELYKSLGNG